MPSLSPASSFVSYLILFYLHLCLHSLSIPAFGGNHIHTTRILLVSDGSYYERRWYLSGTLTHGHITLHGQPNPLRAIYKQGFSRLRPFSSLSHVSVVYASGRAVELNQIQEKDGSALPPLACHLYIYIYMGNSCT